MADEMHQTLDIPNGTTFEFKDGKLIFGHESDIVIRTNMGGYKFRKIFSKKGNVQVIPPEGVEFEVDEIEAGEGDIFLNGAVQVHSMRARTVHFQSGRLSADRIEAAQEIVLSGGELSVLQATAPKVTLDPDSAGTCLVIESDNDVGAHRARGGFRTVAEARGVLSRLDDLARGETPAREQPAAPPASKGEPKPAAAEAPAPAPAPPQEEDASGSDEESSPSAAATQEFKVDAPRPAPSLPKSSVFRKRR